MDRNLTVCNHCADKIVLSLNEHVMIEGLTFCSLSCAEAFFSEDNSEPFPCGLVHDLGLEEGRL